MYKEDRDSGLYPRRAVYTIFARVSEKNSKKGDPGLPLKRVGVDGNLVRPLVVDLHKKWNEKTISELKEKLKNYNRFKVRNFLYSKEAVKAFDLVWKAT
jgi:hypothetical protein